MAIPMICSCGKSLLIKPELAGKRVKCPQCKEILEVPADSSEPIETNIEVEEPQKPALKYVTAKAVKPRPEPEPEEDDEDEPRPRRSRRRRRRRRYDSGHGGSFVMNRFVIYGGILTGFAVFWLVGGLFIGYIFYVPCGILVVGLLLLAFGIWRRFSAER
jgi:hypothetical protein